MANYLMLTVETLVYIFLGAYVLSLIASLFRLEDSSFKTAVFVSSIVALINLILKIFLDNSRLSKFIILIITAIIAIFLIDFKYDAGLKKNLYLWISWQAALYVLLMIFGTISGVIIAFLA